MIGHVLQRKTIIQYLNVFAIEYCVPVVKTIFMEYTTKFILLYPSQCLVYLYIHYRIYMHVFCMNYIMSSGSVAQCSALLLRKLEVGGSNPTVRISEFKAGNIG